MDYFKGMIIDRTGGTTLDEWLNKPIRAALGTDGQGELPEELADLFSVEPVKVDGEVKVIIDFMDD